MTDPQRLPPDLPVPPDDGACRHLPGLRMPALALPGTGGGTVDLGRATPAWTVPIASRARASQATRRRRTGTGSPAREAAPRKPATSATIINH